MFEFFKKRVKDAFSKFSRKVDEEGKDLEPEESEINETISKEKDIKSTDIKKESIEDEEKIKEKNTNTEKKKTDENNEINDKISDKDVDNKISDKEGNDSKDDNTPKIDSSVLKTSNTKIDDKISDKEEDNISDKEKDKISDKDNLTQKDEKTNTKKEINVEDKEGVVLKKDDKNKEANPVKLSFLNKINPFAKKISVKGEDKFPDEKEAKEIKKQKRSFSEEYITGEKKNFIEKISDSITKKSLSESQFNDLFWDLEIALLENNVAVEVVDLLKKELREKLVNKPLPRSKIPEVIEATLKETIEIIFEFEPIDLIRKVKQKKPFKILIVGINGSGKTTTIAKLCKLFQDNSLKPVIAASDTFRAAAIDQLEEHANNLKIKMIKHDYGSDPAAVAFDAIKYAEAKNLDVVLIDTAGRLHSNSNLMDELKKVNRIANPDFTLFIGESITGNDCVEQAKEFNKAISIDGIILSKADIDEKGGAAISIPYVIGKPILYLGVGQDYKDLEKFDKYKIMYRMFGSELRDSN